LDFQLNGLFVLLHGIDALLQFSIAQLKLLIVTAQVLKLKECIIMWFQLKKTIVHSLFHELLNAIFVRKSLYSL